MRALFAPILLAALVSGCASMGAQRTGDTVEPALPAAISADLGLTGCFEIGGGRLISFEHARTLLPPGVEPADAAGFLGMPAPTGGSAALAGHVVCEGSVADGGPVSWSNLIVPIEAPDVSDAPPAVGFHLYQLAHYTSGEETLALLRSVGVAAERAEVEAAHTLAASVPHGSASTTTDNGTLAAFELTGGMPQPYHLVGRFWHETPTGIAFFDHARTPTTVRIGPLNSCAAAPGSPFAAAWGEDCVSTGSMGGLFAEPTDFETTFHFLPGVRIAAASSG